MPTYTGTNDAETLTGSNAADVIDGMRGNDNLFGLDGTDDFTYRLGRSFYISQDSDGADVIDGGLGVDRFSVLATENEAFFGSSGNTYDFQRLSLGAGASGEALFTASQYLNFLGSGSSTVTNVVTLRSVETASFTFTDLPPSPANFPTGTFGTFYSTVDRISIGDLSTTGLTGLLDFYLGHGDDLFDARAAINVIFAQGAAGNDELRGGTANDHLDGGADNDLLVGGAGANTILGGSGVDTLDYSAAIGGVNVDLNEGRAVNNGYGALDIISGVENLTGSEYNDVLVGQAGANIIFGGAGADYLIGLGGNDRLVGGAGMANTLQGGQGDDDYEVAAVGDTLVEFAGEGLDRVFTALSTFTLRDNVEELYYRGSASFTGAGNAGANHIAGGTGNDVLSGAGGNDTLVGGAGVDAADYSAAATGVFARLDFGVASNDGDGGSDTLSEIENLIGSAFDDLLFGDELGNLLQGGQGRDTILGLGGDDVIMGGSGTANELYGGAGDDYYVVEANDTVVEADNDGIDTVELRLDTFVLRVNVENLVYGGTGNFTGVGNASNNLIIGGAGADRLVGGAGLDTLNGGEGRDLADYSGAAAGVTVRLDRNQASNDGDGASDVLNGVEDVRGSAFADVIFGDAGANTLWGGDGYDVLAGFDGDDVIHGGAGAANELYGGAGNDRYVVEAEDTIVEQAGEGVDLVETGLARFRLSANVENLTYTGAGSFIGIGSGTANTITGGAQRDVLLGLDGDDILIGGAGAANELYGGTGNDTYIMDVADTVVESFGEGTDTVQLRGLHTLTLGANVENLSVIGTGNYTGYGNALGNVMTGGVGNDAFAGAGGNDLLIGGAGTDAAVLSGIRADYTITAVVGGWTVTDNTAGRDGTDTLIDMEQLRFSDGTTLALETAAALLLTSPLIEDDGLLFGSKDDAEHLPLRGDETVCVFPFENLMDDFGYQSQEATFGGGDDTHWMLTLLPSSSEDMGNPMFGHPSCGSDLWS